MSHFSVCVAIPAVRLKGVQITRERIDDIVEEILAPYDVAADEPQYMEFDDHTAIAKEEYETASISAARFLDGHFEAIYSSCFTSRFRVEDGGIYMRKRGANGELQETDESRALTLIPEIPVKEIFSFEEYCSEYCCYAQDNEGRWGYWFNPNAQWDWFQIGGRFSARLLVPAAQNAIGTEDGENDGAPNGFAYADGARVGDIAWGKMKELARIDQKRGFEALKSVFKTGDTKSISSLIVKKDVGIYNWNGELLCKDGEPYEEYHTRRGLADAEEYDLSTYAFVDKAGRWISSGDMGCWGLSINDRVASEWKSEMQSYLKQLDSDDFIVILDCHI